MYALRAINSVLVMSKKVKPNIKNKTISEKKKQEKRPFAFADQTVNRPHPFIYNTHT